MISDLYTWPEIIMEKTMGSIYLKIAVMKKILGIAASLY
jgi:hypothetical protein